MVLHLCSDSEWRLRHGFFGSKDVLGTDVNASSRLGSVTMN